MTTTDNATRTCRYCGKPWEDEGDWGGVIHTDGTHTCATATRVTIWAARAHFNAGGRVAVSDRGHEASFRVGPLTGTHTATTTTWDALVAAVRSYGDPRQRYYTVTADA